MEYKVSHFEIPVDDMGRAQKFYSEIFGWQVSEWPMEDGEVYTGVITTAIEPDKRAPKEPGGINGGMFERDQTLRNPILTISVPSIDEFASQIKQAGGEIVVPKKEAKGVGYYAYFKDSEGNLMGLWQKLA